MNTSRISNLLIFLWGISISAAGYSVYDSEEYYKELLATDDLLMQFLDQYIEREDAKLQEMKQSLEIIEADNLALEDSKSYEDDPNKTLRLMKRLTYDWRDVIDHASKNVSQDLFVILERRLEEMRMPEDETTLPYAIDSVLRIKEYLGIDHTNFADGNWGRIKTNTSLSADDCFVIGDELLREDTAEKLVESAFWFTQSLHRLDVSDDVFELQPKLIKALATVFYKTGKADTVLNIAEQKLQEQLDDRIVQFTTEIYNLQVEAGEKEYADEMDDFSSEDFDDSIEDTSEDYKPKELKIFDVYDQMPSLDYIFKSEFQAIE